MALRHSSPDGQRPLGPVAVGASGGGMGDGDGACWRPAAVAGPPAAGGWGKLWPLRLMKRSMTGDTVDGSAAAGRGRAGGAVDCRRGGRSWAAHGPGSARARAAAAISIEWPGGPFHHPNPTPFTESLDAIAGVRPHSPLAGVHRVAGGGPLPTGGRNFGRVRSTGWTSPGGCSSATSCAG